MMSLLLTLIRSNVAAAVLAVLLMLSSFYGYWLRAEVATCEAQLVDTKSKALSLERSNVSLLAALKQQNAAVSELVRQSEAKKRQAATLGAGARQKSYVLQKAADDIMGFKPEGATECEQIKALLGEFSRSAILP